MSKHTPGPWYAGSDTYPIGILSAHRNGKQDPEQICLIGGDVMAPESAEENEANARLIAAAPELLEALRKCSNLMGHPFVGQPSDDELPAWSEWREKAKAVIAKVERLTPIAEPDLGPDSTPEVFRVAGCKCLDSREPYCPVHAPDEGAAIANRLEERCESYD